MLNEIIKLKKEDRDAFLKIIPPSINVYMFNKVYTMTEELELNKTADRETRVQMRYDLIQKFPDAVFWDYAEIERDGEIITLDCVLISTDGCCVVITYEGRLLITVSSDSHHKHYVRIKRDKIRLTLNRIMALTFIPIPERLKEIPLSKLYTNHIDNIRNSNYITNLEWVTNQENQKHAFKYEDYLALEYFLFEVIVDNGFKGRKFVLDFNEITIFKENSNALRQYTRGANNGMWYGMKIIAIKENESKQYHRGFPEDIAELFNKDKMYFNTSAKPMIGTVLVGEYKGTEFSFMSNPEARIYFYANAPRACANGKRKSNHGCSFRWATLREAIPLHGKFTEEIAKSLEKYKDK